MVPDGHSQKASGAFFGITMDNNSHFGWTAGSTNGICYGYNFNAIRCSTIYKDNFDKVVPKCIYIAHIIKY